MKNLMLSVLSFFIINASLAQETVPEAVEGAFARLHSAVEKPYWESRKEAFVAMFSNEEGLKKVFFSKDGYWMETRTRMKPSDLPVGVLNFINQHHKNSEITYLGMVERPDGLVYRIESESTDAVVIKSLNAQGHLLKSEKIDFNNRQFIIVLDFPLPSSRQRKVTGRGERA